jgi:hypothetical protein
MMFTGTTMIGTVSVNVRGIENGRPADGILNESERGTGKESAGRKESPLIAVHVTDSLIAVLMAHNEGICKRMAARVQSQLCNLEGGEGGWCSEYVNCLSSL